MTRDETDNLMRVIRAVDNRKVILTNDLIAKSNKSAKR